jgi:hypothetical protein
VSHAVVHGSCSGSIRSHSKQRNAPGPLPSAGNTCACRQSNPDILVVQPAENWAAKNLPSPFDGARERRILLQGEMRARAIVIFHVRQQQVTEVALAEHDNVVKAFPSDRTDQAFGVSVLPWGTRRCRLIANAH